jgi:anti-anti-sigma factor
MQPVESGPGVRVKCDESDAGVVCYLAGNLEHLTVGRFREGVVSLADKKRVIFELSAVPFVDSAGLGALIGTIRCIRDNGGDAVVCAARPSVSRVFDIVGLRRVVFIAKSVDEAQTHLVPSFVGNFDKGAEIPIRVT